MTTNEPITQIAYDCGFGSQSTFNRVFKELFGMSPRQLRRLESAEQKTDEAAEKERIRE